MEGSTITSSQVFPTDKTVSVIYDVPRETERGKNAIASRPRLAEVRTVYAIAGTSRSVRRKII